jgi:hypothetical protein
MVEPELDVEAALRWIDRVARFLRVPTTDSARHDLAQRELAAEVEACPTVSAVRALPDLPAWALREVEAMFDAEPGAVSA